MMAMLTLTGPDQTPSSSSMRVSVSWAYSAPNDALTARRTSESRITPLSPQDAFYLINRKKGGALAMEWPTDSGPQLRGNKMRTNARWQVSNLDWPITASAGGAG